MKDYMFLNNSKMRFIYMKDYIFLNNSKMRYNVQPFITFINLVTLSEGESDVTIILNLMPREEINKFQNEKQNAAMKQVMQEEQSITN